MTLSQYSATTIVPLLARIVLFLAFIWAGSAKLFGEPVTFDGRSADILQQLDIGRPANSAASRAGSRIMPAALQTDDAAARSLRGSRSAVADEETPARSQDDNALDDQPPPPPDDDLPLDEPPPEVDAPEDELRAPAAPRVAHPIHRITVQLVDGGWDMNWKPHWMAWLAGVTEFAGAILLLVGMFSRVWALGLCIVMGFAFYLTSLPILQETMYFKLDTSHFNMLFSQIGLFALAFTVLVSGPGPLSLDRAIFRRHRGEEIEEED